MTADNPATTGPRVQISPRNAKMSLYRVYVVQNAEGKFYIGVSEVFAAVSDNTMTAGHVGPKGAVPGHACGKVRNYHWEMLESWETC